MTGRSRALQQHRLPLTPDASREAFLTVPRDITPTEAGRVVQFVLTLPLPEQSKRCPHCGGAVLVPGSDHYIGGRWRCSATTDHAPGGAS